MSVIARRYFVRAQEALRGGDLDSARGDLEAALQLAPYHVQARAALARVMLRSGDARRAADLVVEGLTAEARAGRAGSAHAAFLQRTLGEVLMVAGDYRGAEAALAIATEAGQGAGEPQRELWDRLARLRAKTGRFAESLEQLLLAARAAR